MATRKPTTHNYKYGSVVAPSLPQPTRLTPQQLEEKRVKGLCYNCDNKYTKGHKRAKRKLFHIDCEKEEENNQETSKEEDIHEEPTPEKEEMNLNISCSALARITTPQTLKIDGQTEIVNKCLEGYLSCLVSDKQTQWVKWLPLVEWWYNTSTKMNPFMALYGYHPPSITSSLRENSKVQAMEDHITHQQQVLQLLKDNLMLVHN